MLVSIMRMEEFRIFFWDIKLIYEYIVNCYFKSKNVFLGIIIKVLCCELSF